MLLDEPPNFIRADDGAEIAYWDTGEEEKVPLVFVHGFPETSLSWEAVIDALGEAGEQYRLIAYDLRGHGQSSKTGEASWQRFFQDHLNLVEALKLNQYHLIGHDWGGATGLHVARFLPESIKSLVVMNTNYWKTDLKGMFHLIFLNIPVIPTLSFRWIPDVLFEKTIVWAYQDKSKLSKKHRDTYLKMCRDPATSHYWIRLYRSMARSLLAQTLPKHLKKYIANSPVNLPQKNISAFQVPITLIWGKADTFNPLWVAQDMEKRLKKFGAQCELKLIEGAGHFVQEENPTQTALHIQAHLDSVGK